MTADGILNLVTISFECIKYVEQKGWGEMGGKKFKKQLESN